MPQEYRFSCPLIHGLHARPASMLAEQALRFNARITLTNERSHHSADCSSVLELVAAGVMPGDLCLLTMEGPQADEARSALVEFITDSLPHCDAPVPYNLQGTESPSSLPYVLRGNVDNWLRGIAAGAGLAIAVAAKVGGISLPADFEELPPQDADTEVRRFELARDAVLSRQQRQMELSIGKLETEIQQALLSLARDRSLYEGIVRLIREEQCSVATAIVRAIGHFTDRLASSGSIYLQERRGDIEDVGLQLLEEITGRQLRGKPLQLMQPSIVCAPSLSTSSMLSLDKSLLRGLVLGESGLTSHTVILARSHDIPVVAGVSDQSSITNGMQLYLDGTRGVLIPSPDARASRYISRESSRTLLLQEYQSDLRTRQGCTADGRKIEIAANLSSPSELELALDRGAEGIGLFRTEMLFAAGDRMPTEDEQTAVYAELANKLAGRRLIIRTIDIGADKQIPWLDMPQEENPFLGLRGIRFCQRYPEILQIQLRALIRAAASGPLWVMAPMISNTLEARWFREQYEIARQDLIDDGHEDPARLSLGCMIEVPSAALQIRALSEHCEFFSIGSNDLAQYTLAVDRGNESVARLYRELDPAFLRLLKMICDEAGECGRWVGLCGEFAGLRLHAPLLAGLELDELSMSAPAIPALKRTLSMLDSRPCRELLDRCIRAADADEVLEMIQSHNGNTLRERLVSARLVKLDSGSRDKAEAIRELCGLCELDGRTDDIDGLEDAVHEREATYSTGLGHGIAIPHCRNSRVRSASLAVLKLASPIEWQALDDQPVDIVLLLAMPSSGDGREHLKVFASLARHLMHEDFRSGLRNCGSAEEIVEFLSRELELTEEKT